MSGCTDLISIIVPVYNSEKYLEQCIESIINQTYKKLEVILVDDGSTDNSKKICDEYAQKDSRILAIHKENQGVSSARNVGIEKANGKYIYFADSDDYLDCSLITEMYSNFQENDVDVVVCEYNCHNQNENVDNKLHYMFDEKKISFQELVMNNDYMVYGYLWNKMFKKKDIKKFFNEKVHVKEDLLFLLMNYENNTLYSVIRKPLYNYRIYDNSTIHKKGNLISLTSIYAEEWISRNINNQYTINYKNAFVSNYFNLWKECKDDKYIINNKDLFLEFITDINNSPIISKKVKIKNKIKKLLIGTK